MSRVVSTAKVTQAISVSLFEKLADDVKDGSLAAKVRRYKLEAEGTGAAGVELDVLVHRRLLEDMAREIGEIGQDTDA
jgi:hypothetical protein